MMKRMIWKSTFREIRQSLGRFCAILAIVALGVAFYAGLTVTKSAMVQTADNYLTERNFYDYRLLSTMGFRPEEVAFLQGKEGVARAEGAVSFDIICRDGSGADIVYKVHSITEEINSLELVSGRMPEKANECVVDSEIFTADDIGKSITLSANNAEEDRDYFEYEEYTVVGVVQSPLYIQFERGNTSLGSGKLTGYFYIPYEGFDIDFYTELYVKFTENFPMYSDAYDEFLEEKEVLWEEYAAEAAYMMYAEIKGEAEAELKDAKDEFAAERADAEAELADAWEELEDARVQLEDAKAQLEDARVEIEDGEVQLADAKEELADARVTIADKEKELADAKSEIADKEKELSDGEQALNSGIARWNASKSQLENSKKELAQAKSDLEQQKANLESKEAELQSAEATIATMQTTLEQVGQLYGEDSSEWQELNQKLTGAKAELEAGKAALAEGKATIAAYEKQLNDSSAQLSAGEQQLANAWAEIQTNKKTIEDGKTALADAKLQIEDGERQIADGKAELEEGEQTLLEKEQELADGKAEYEDGLKEYEDGLAEYEDGLAEYEDGLAEFNTEIADAEKEIADAEQEIAEIEVPESYLLGRDTNVGYVCFENDSAIIEGIAKVFPAFFFAVAALVCITTMNRMVEEQRTQIGVLKALGYSERTVMTKYMFYAGSAAIAGCVIGYAGGTWLFPRVIWVAYGIMYSMNGLLYIFDWQLAVISLVVSVLCSMGATWLSCRVELNQVAAQLMRPKAPKSGKRVFLEYIPFVWKRLGFLRKVSLRNIFRYKKRLFMMVMGISGCTALLVTGYGVKDSIADVVSQQYEEIQIYDINIVFTEAYTEADAAAIESAAGVSSDAYVPVYETNYDLVTEQGRKAVNVIVSDSETDMTKFIQLRTDEKKSIAFPGVGEVVITDKLAEDYELQVGDTITLQNEELQTLTVKISGINQNFIYNYAYINNETYRQQTGSEPEEKNVYLNVPEDVDLHLVSAELMGEDNVASATVSRDMMVRLNSMLKSLDLIVLVIILCAGGLAFIVLYNLTNINITERIREIATIKVLGFNKKETASYVFRENMMLAAMGTAVGLVLGHYLHLFVMSQVSIDMIAFDTHVRPVSYLYSVLLTFGFAWIVNKVMGRKLDNVSMTESLKSVD